MYCVGIHFIVCTCIVCMHGYMYCVCMGICVLCMHGYMCIVCMHGYMCIVYMHGYLRNVCSNMYVCTHEILPPLGKHLKRSSIELTLMAMDLSAEQSLISSRREPVERCVMTMHGRLSKVSIQA